MQLPVPMLMWHNIPTTLPDAFSLSSVLAHTIWLPLQVSEWSKYFTLLVVVVVQLSEATFKTVSNQNSPHYYFWDIPRK